MLLYLYSLYFVLSSWSPVLTLMHSTQRSVTFCDFCWFCLQLHVQFPWIISCCIHTCAFGGKSGSHFSWVEWYYSKLDFQSNCLFVLGGFFFSVVVLLFFFFSPLLCWQFSDNLQTYGSEKNCSHSPSSCCHLVAEFSKWHNHVSQTISKMATT